MINLKELLTALKYAAALWAILAILALGGWLTLRYC